MFNRLLTLLYRGLLDLPQEQSGPSLDVLEPRGKVMARGEALPRKNTLQRIQT